MWRMMMQPALADEPLWTQPFWCERSLPAADSLEELCRSAIGGGVLNTHHLRLAARVLDGYERSIDVESDDEIAIDFVIGSNRHAVGLRFLKSGAVRVYSHCDVTEDVLDKLVDGIRDELEKLLSGGISRCTASPTQ